MPSNLVLLCLGLLLGVGSTLYPRLPEVLPASLVAHLPFLDAASLAASTSSWSVYEKYQASIPIIENHDPFAEKLPPGERKMRMGSKIDKEIVGEGDFTRVETAGAENLVGMELPVYFVEQAPSEAMVDPNSALAQSWQRIGDEITSRVRPTTIVLLSPLRSKTSAVTINSSPLAPLLYSHTSSNPYQPPFTCAGSTAVANTIHRLLAESALLSVRTWERGLDPASWGVLVGLFGNTVEAKVVQVSLPVTADPAVTVEYLSEVGARLREMRDEGVVVIGIGRAPESTAAPWVALQDTLTFHTAQPREISLAALISSTSGKKPSSGDRVPANMLGLVVAVGAAGSSEGEYLGEGGWRFGAVPLRAV